MRLLCVWPSAEMSTYDCAAGLKAGLVAEGHDVRDFLLYQRLKLMWLAYGNIVPDGLEPAPEMVALQASEGLPFVVITQRCQWTLVVSGMGIHPNAIWAVREMGGRVAVWFTEAPYESTEGRELSLAQLCDVAFVNERTAVPTFQSALDKAGNGGRACYLPHSFNPAVHQPGEPGSDMASDVLLVGTGFRERQWLLEAIDWSGIDLRLGGVWTGIQEPSHLAPAVRETCMHNADLVRLYHGAKIVLNPHRWAEGAESANPRTYEAAACGAFQIADRRQEIVDIFGESVPTFEPGVPWQLSALIRRYLADDGERQRLAHEAMRRVQEHNFAARARYITGILQAHDAFLASRKAA